jgi:hypothetical protein
VILWLLFWNHEFPLAPSLYLPFICFCYALRIQSIRRNFLNSSWGNPHPTCEGAGSSLCVLSRPDMCALNIITPHPTPSCMTGLAPVKPGCFHVCPPRLVFFFVPNFFFLECRLVCSRKGLPYLHIVREGRSLFSCNKNGPRARDWGAKTAFVTSPDKRNAEWPDQVTGRFPEISLN